MEGFKMLCPKCQFENREGVKFCEECGAKFELECPACKASIPHGRKFCGECGHDFKKPSEAPPKDLTFDEKLTKIQRYLPKGLTEKILSQKDRIEGERKQVTVMFADMEGFTQLSERLGPEEAYTVMDQVYEILIHKVHNYEGTVNEFTGDGIMALFGAPIALEDAPQRAIRSAYAIHREMTKFNDNMKQEKEDIPSIKMRIGIHTGPVVVGTLGNDLRVEFKAVGDTVNLASRMEGLAEPATTCVSEETFKLTEGFFRFEALGEKQIKGKEEPVKTYRVIAPSTRRTRFDVSAERGLTNFAGRERELELLLDGFGRAKEGRGQAFSIVAEAGVGKSRLLYEFRKVVINENATFLEGKCLSYSKNVAYHPVIDILKSNFDIIEGDTDFEIREKVINGLNILGVDETTTLPYVLELLSVKDSGIDKIPMSPEAEKDRIIEAVKRITLRGSEIRPLIIAIEDLHWIDKSSEDYLKVLLDSISGARIFLIFTYRPEFVQTWGGKSYHNQVNLNRLSNRESLMMVFYLLTTEELDNDLENLILEKTEGVPFFIEEFVRSLKDLKLVEKKDGKFCLVTEYQDLTIPSTIQDVIMARVDSLPEGAKEVLQAGSVIEREFSYDLIKRVTSLGEKNLLSQLSVLKDSEILYERGIYPQSTYIFKHTLTREVVYDSILTRRKKQLHESIGNAIENVCKDNVDEYYALLADHYIIAENYQKGAKYSRLADKKAEKAAAFPDAITYAQKGIECLERLPKTDDVLKKIIDARTILGLYMFQLFHFAEAKDTINPVIESALEIGYKKRLAQIYSITGAYECWVEENFSKAIQDLEQSLKISKEANDTVSLFFASVWSGFTLFYNCEYEKMISHVQVALDINVAANNLWGISALKSNLSRAFNYQGKINLGYQTSDEALRIAEKSGDTYSKASAYFGHGSSCFFMGNFEEAEKDLLNAVELSEKINWLAISSNAHNHLGETYFSIGKYQKSKNHYKKAILSIERGRFLPSLIYVNEISMARTRVMNNEKDIDLKSLFNNVPENKLKVYDGLMRRYIGEILLNIDGLHLSDAEEWIKRAIEADNRNGTMFNLAGDYELYAKWFKRKGDLSKAKENLNKAIEIYKECGAVGWVEKYEKELALLM
jgi:class 3 adenylate cyclase/tetratricopeptide (TPR) repeat protein